MEKNLKPTLFTPKPGLFLLPPASAGHYGSCRLGPDISADIEPDVMLSSHEEELMLISNGSLAAGDE